MSLIPFVPSEDQLTPTQMRLLARILDLTDANGYPPTHKEALSVNDRHAFSLNDLRKLQRLGLVGDGGDSRSLVPKCVFIPL